MKIFILKKLTVCELKWLIDSYMLKVSFYIFFSKHVYRILHTNHVYSNRVFVPFELKFRFPPITFSLVNWFTSYSHTLLLMSALWPWISDHLDIQHCSSTICVLFFSYNLFIRWQIYFILTHNVALVETFTLICHIVTFKWPWHWAT